MHSTLDDQRIGLVFIGFSPLDRLRALARHLGWPGLVLSDPDRKLYAALGIGRAPLWRVWNRRTLQTYARAWRKGHRPPSTAVRPGGQGASEDTRQLGGDAVLVDGVVVRLWRPRSPDDRPSAAEVVGEAVRLVGR